MANELYLAESKLLEMSKNEDFSERVRKALKAGSQALATVSKLGDLNEVLNKEVKQ